MKDRYDEDLKQKPLESHERLETVAFHLNQLYQRLSQEFDRWAVTGGNLADAVEVFENQLQQLATLEERLKQQLNHFLEEETKQTIHKLTDFFRQAIQAVLAENIKETADDFFKMVQEAKYALKAHQQEMVNTRKWWYIIAFISALSGIIIGGAIIYLLQR